MFGILKAGIKLGIGCTLAIILTVALLVGGLYWYFTRPAPQPKPRNRRAALIPQRDQKLCPTEPCSYGIITEGRNPPLGDS